MTTYAQQIAEAVIEAAAKKCDSIHWEHGDSANASWASDAIRALDRDAIIASVPNPPAMQPARRVCKHEWRKRKADEPWLVCENCGIEYGDREQPEAAQDERKTTAWLIYDASGCEVLCTVYSADAAKHYTDKGYKSLELVAKRDALTQARELTDAVTPWQQRGRDGTARDDQRAMEDEIRELRALLSASKGEK